MSRIFLSHSSKNTREALALKLWLESQGWRDEVFLDVDPNTGIRLGNFWRKELADANRRCEALICLLSRDWLASAECIAEFRTAENLSDPKPRKIFICALEANDGMADSTRAWQSTDLYGSGEQCEISLGADPVPVRLLATGLRRLHLGLIDAGLSGLLPQHFPWPPQDDPNRSPYPGLRPLDVQDAAVFFGRDAEILAGLAVLGRLRREGIPAIFAILGASGVGKSSFLRAGLWPRLRRDDRNFYVLDVVRPKIRPLSGPDGLAQSLSAASRALGLPLRNPGDVLAALGKDDGLVEILSALRDAAHRRIRAATPDAEPPFLLLPIDQADEIEAGLSADDGAKSELKSEFALFLESLGNAMRIADRDAPQGTPPAALIVALTIRSDRFGFIQTAPQLRGVKLASFSTLRPMDRAQYRAVIEGPAARATGAGRRLEITAKLSHELIEDCQKQSADPLPLLALTLERLYQDFSAGGKLTFEQYKSMGRMERIIREEAESVLSSDPVVRARELEILREAFIANLVSIDLRTNQVMRRPAPLDDFSPESQTLVLALRDKHLLLSDSRDDGGNSQLEIAHESLLRCWPELEKWVGAATADLRAIERLNQDAAEWAANRDNTSLLLHGTRLATIEELASGKIYGARINPAETYITASRQAADVRAAEEQAREELERQNIGARMAAEEQRRIAEERAQLEANTAARLRKRALQLFGAVLMALIMFVGTSWLYVKADEQRALATLAQRQTNSVRLAFEARMMLDRSQPGGDERAMLQVLAAHRTAPHREVDGALSATLIATSKLSKVWHIPIGTTCVALSPDGRRIVSGSMYNTLWLWNADTGGPIGTPLTGHEGSVSSVAFSPDGRRIVSGSGDGTLRLWNADTGETIGAPLSGHEGPVWSVAFRPDGRHIVSGGWDDTVRLWNAATGGPIGTPLTGHEGPVTSVAFSPDGRRIVSGSDDNTLRLWNADTGESIGMPLTGHEGAVTNVAFSLDGRIVSASDDNTLRLWNAATGEPIGTALTGHTNSITSVAFSPDGRRIVSASDDNTLRLWNVDTGEIIGTPITGHTSRVTSVAFSPDGRRIVSTSGDNTLRLWSADNSESIGMPLTGHEGRVTSVAFSPDGQHIVSASDDNSLRLWNVDTREPTGNPLTGHTNSVTSAAFSPDGRRIVSASDDNTLRLWSTDTGETIGRPTIGHTKLVLSVAFSPEGRYIISGSRDNTLWLRNADTGEPIGTPLTGHEDSVSSVVFSPDGRRIVSGSSDNTLQLWNANTGDTFGTRLSGHKDEVTSVAFSPDGRRIVSGSGDTTLRLWNADTGEPIGTPLTGHEGWVSSVAFSPDGRRIVSGSSDDTLRLWTANTGETIGLPLAGHSDTVTSVAFSPDGRRIVSGSWDNTLRLWPAPDAWPDLICSKLTRNMSRREWRAWVSAEMPYVCQCPGLPIAPDDSQSGEAPETCPEAEAGGKPLASPS